MLLVKTPTKFVRKLAPVAILWCKAHIERRSWENHWFQSVFSPSLFFCLATFADATRRYRAIFHMAFLFIYLCTSLSLRHGRTQDFCKGEGGGEWKIVSTFGSEIRLALLMKYNQNLQNKIIYNKSRSTLQSCNKQLNKNYK